MKKKALTCLIVAILAVVSIFSAGNRGQLAVIANDVGCCQDVFTTTICTELQDVYLSQFLDFFEKSSVQLNLVYNAPLTRGIAEGFYVLANYEEVMDVVLMFFDYDVELIEGIIGAPLTPHSVLCLFGHMTTTFGCNIKIGPCHGGDGTGCRFESRTHSHCPRCGGNRMTTNRQQRIGCANLPRSCPSGFPTLFSQ